jgi:hypothetical protein
MVGAAHAKRAAILADNVGQYRSPFTSQLCCSRWWRDFVGHFATGRIFVSQLTGVILSSRGKSCFPFRHNGFHHD